MKYNSSFRIRLISIGILFGALILVYKLYNVQIVNGTAYSERADRQYVKPHENLYNRGAIYFTAKDGTLVSAATLKEGYTVALNPKQMKSIDDAYEKISQIIKLDKADFYSKAGKKDDPYEEIARQVPTPLAHTISDLKITGVQIYKDKWRVYPGKELASHVLGFIGYTKEDVLAGRYGLERQYEDVLKRSGSILYQNFFAELFSNIKRSVSGAKELQGDIITTIEPTVQSFLESSLKKIDGRWNSELSGGIIMNPKTGEIYAMGALPTYDPNNYRDVRNGRVFTNPLVENVYEMGSIIKPLTVAAGLDASVITARSTYNDEGVLVLNGKKISNFDGKGRGVVSMQEVLSQSLNTGVAYIAGKLGKEAFAHYMVNFGLGEKTGIDVPSESRGLIDNLKSTRDIEHATASYGQGIAMSPIAALRALSALGNGGYLPTPHVVRKIDYTLGTAKTIDAPPGRRVISKEASEEVTRILVEVVDKAMLQGKIMQPHYSVAAKTGTAQIANPNGGGYYDDRYLHSFFGYFPAYDPQFIVFLYTVHPKGVRYASETLALPFSDITQFLINYYEVPPDR